jgi:hypothetical protein
MQEVEMQEVEMQEVDRYKKLRLVTEEGSFYFG